jgi:tetratricopeptide (TPR) repeat protein
MGYSFFLLFLVVAPLPEVLMIVISLAGAFFLCSRRWRIVKCPNFFDASGIALLLATSIATLHSQNLQDSLFYLGRLIEAVAVYLIVRSIPVLFRPMLIVHICLYGALRSGLIGIYWTMHYIKMWNAGFRHFLPLRRFVLPLPDGSYSGNLHIVFLIFIGLGAYVFHANRERNKLAVLTGTACVLTNIFCLTLTLSRISYLSIGFTLCTLCFLQVVNRSGALSVRHFFAIGAFVLVVAITTLFSSKIASWVTLSNTWGQKRSLESRSIAERGAVYRTKRNFVLGTGPDTFSFEDCINGDLTEGTCHSEAFSWPIEILSEEGLAGLTILVVICNTLFLAFSRSICASDRTTIAIVAASLAGIVIFICGQSAPFYSAQISNLIFALWGLLATQSGRPLQYTHHRQMRWFSSGFCLSFTLAAAVSLACVEAWRSSYGNSAADNISEAVQLNMAVAQICDRPEDWEKLAFHGERTPFIHKAAEQSDRLLAKALVADPTNDALWHNRAWTQMALGNANDAFHYLKRAEMLSPGDYTYYASQSIFARLQGNRDETVRALSRAVEIEPAILNSRLVANIASTDPTLLPASEHAALVLLAADSESPISQAKAARILYSLGEISEAKGKLENALRIYPGMINAWRLLRTIQLGEGEMEKAEQTGKKIASFNNSFDHEEIGTGKSTAVSLASQSARNVRFFYRYRSQSKEAQTLIPDWLGSSLEIRN